MQYSLVNYKTIKENLDFRIDAEYYHPVILNRLSLLNNKESDFLKNLVKFTVGPFGSTVKVEDYIDDSEYRYIRNKDINDFVISDDDPAFIPQDVYKPLKQFHVKENDLLLTVVGTLGKVAIAQEKDTHSIFSCKSTLLRSKSINPYYLLTYLNSPTGQLFSLRGKRGMIQEGLNLSDLKEIKVFIASSSFQDNIEKIIKEIFKLLNKSINLYFKAERILLSELGLLDWKSKHELAFMKNYSDTQEADRFDAEYFQPKYEEIVEVVKKYKGGFDELGNLVSIKKCIEPGSNAYRNEGIPFVRVSNFSKFEISNNNQKYISEELYALLKNHQPKKGEILLSKDATPRIAYYLQYEPQRMIPSGGILRLKVKDIKIIPEYLTLVLNSIVVQKQIEKDAGGSILTHWRSDQVKSTFIPILNNGRQKEIKELIEKSFNDRHLSKVLLKIAVQAVEMAIKISEGKAEEWIKNELEKKQTNL